MQCPTTSRCNSLEALRMEPPVSTAGSPVNAPADSPLTWLLAPRSLIQMFNYINYKPLRYFQVIVDQTPIASAKRFSAYPDTQTPATQHLHLQHPPSAPSARSATGSSQARSAPPTPYSAGSAVASRGPVQCCRGCGRPGSGPAAHKAASGAVSGLPCCPLAAAALDVSTKMRILIRTSTHPCLTCTQHQPQHRESLQQWAGRHQWQRQWQWQCPSLLQTCRAQAAPSADCLTSAACQQPQAAPQRLLPASSSGALAAAPCKTAAPTWRTGS